MTLFSSIIKNILGELSEEIPIPKRYVARKEKRGYTLFFNDALENFLFDDLSYKFFKEINGTRNCQQIARRVSKSTNLPYLVCCNLLAKYINSFVSLNIISSKTKGNKRFNLSKPKDFIPSAPNQIAVLLTNECNLLGGLLVKTVKVDI